MISKAFVTLREHHIKINGKYTDECDIDVLHGSTFPHSEN